MVVRYSTFLCWQNLELLHQLVAWAVRNLKSHLKTKPIIKKTKQIVKKTKQIVKKTKQIVKKQNKLLLKTQN